jgi:hypothetical protein
LRGYATILERPGAGVIARGASVPLLEVLGWEWQAHRACAAGTLAAVRLQPAAMLLEDVP